MKDTVRKGDRSKMCRPKHGRDLGMQNLRGAFCELQAFLRTPTLLDDLPDGQRVNLVSLVVDDPELFEYNLKIVASEIARRVPSGSKLQISVEAAESSAGSKPTRGHSKEQREWQLTTTSS